MSEVLSATNLKFLAQGMWTTLYLSFFIIVSIYCSVLSGGDA